MKNEPRIGLNPLQFIIMQRFSLVSVFLVILAGIISFSVHKYNLFSGGFIALSIPCSILSFVCNLVFFFVCRTHRSMYFAMAVLFSILIYLLLFGFNGRSVLWELHQYRRDRWFFEVGKPVFEKYVSQNTNHLGKTMTERGTDIPEVRIRGKRNEDGAVDLEFVLVGGVPRQAYLYHTGDPTGKFPRQYRSVKMVTNYWFDVSF